MSVVGPAASIYGVSKLISRPVFAIGRRKRLFPRARDFILIPRDLINRGSCNCACNASRCRKVKSFVRARVIDITAEKLRLPDVAIKGINITKLMILMSLELFRYRHVRHVCHDDSDDSRKKDYYLAAPFIS